MNSKKKLPSEIGSEFWLEDSSDSTAQNFQCEAYLSNSRTYLSGRTALGAILDDICLTSQSTRPLSAYLPSYCCHTMIEPFLRHGMEVSFYTVAVQNGELVQQIDCSKNCDIVLVLDYFGYQREHGLCPNGSTVIRDMTHSLFSENAYCDDADYTFASFRKWGAVAGAAIASKRNGSWLTEEASKQNAEYIALRNSGYKDKTMYIAGKAGTGKGYLETFQKAEALLETDYVDYAADTESLNIAGRLNFSVKQRRENAQKLLAALVGLSIAEPMFPTLADGDVPLFVPIAVKCGKRDALRKYLINNSVYCPVHWALSELHRISFDEQVLYNCELSLICDQRYDAADMERQINAIKGFERENA